MNVSIMCVCGGGLISHVFSVTVCGGQEIKLKMLKVCTSFLRFFAYSDSTLASVTA